MASRNDLSVSVRATLNTTDIPEQIKRLNAELVRSKSSTIKVNIGTEENPKFVERIKQVRTLKDEYGRLYQHIVQLNKTNGLPIKGTEQIKSITDKVSTLTTEIHKWTDTQGNINTWTTTVDSTGQQITTRVKESVTALGEITTETSKWGQKTIEVNGQLKSVYGQIGDSIKQVKEFTTDMTTTTNSSMGRITDTVNGVTNTYRGLITTTEKVGSNGEYLKTVVSEYTNEMGQAVVKTEQFDKTGKQVATTERQISDETKKLGMSFSDAFDRLSQFYLASLPIRAVQTAVTNAIETIKDFDSALIEFRKVSDLAGESLTNYVAKLAEMGEVTGSTMQAMVEASTEFRKSGFSDEDSAKLASIAEKYRNIADEEISAGESASFIIAQMKAFNIEADQAEHIIDSVNEVANNFSVSSADLATNLGNMSAIMAINNVSMEEQIGMLTGVTEITRNASSASRGLVMISSRLTQVLDDSSSTGKKLIKIYNDLDIKLKDENGQLRGHYEILGDLAEKWNTLSENEQKYIALTSAGARQQQNFVALMENWSQVVDATTKAYGSLGSAQRENEKVMDSVEKKVEILTSQFQQLVIGDGGLQEVAKTILDVGIALLKFANSDAGQATIATTGLVVALNLLNKAFGSKLVTSIMATIDEFIALIAAEISATGVTGGLTLAVKTLTTAIMESPLVLAGLIVAGVAASVAIMDKLIVTLDESTEKLKELSSTVAQNEQDLENLKKQLENVEKSIESINNQPSLSIIDEQELEQLKGQSEEIQRHIKLKEQELETTKKLAEEEAKRNLNTSGVEISPSFSTTQSGALKFYTDQITELINKQKELEKQGKENSKEYQNLSEKINETTSKGNELANALQQDADALISTDKTTKQLKNDTVALIDSWLDATDTSAKFKHELEQKLDEYSKGGNVDLKLRPVIDAEELNEQGYKAGEGFATVFSSTFYNEADDLAINFTPIMTDENGNYIGVMEAHEFDQYCNDVVNGVKEDSKNLQIGLAFKKEDYDDFKEAAENATIDIHELSEAYVIATGAADDYTNAINAYTDETEEFADATEETDDIVKKFAKDLGISEDELIANAEAAGLSVSAYYNCASAIKQADAAIDNFQSSISTLKNAIDEYNESQEFSIDTVQSLLQLSPEYLSMLIEENGQLKLNENAIVNKANALIEERKQTALQMAYEKLAAIERGNNQSAAESESSAIDGNTSSLDAETTALSKNTVEQYANRIARNDKSKGTAASEVVRELERELKILDKIGNSYSSITSSAKKAGSAGKSGAGKAKDAQKELNKELEKTKSNYEKVISYINKQYDRKTSDLEKEKKSATAPIESEIKALEKEKDSVLNAIENEINAIEDERDGIIDGIEKEIKALEKERDTIVDGVEDKIDALEDERDKFTDAIQSKIDILEAERDAFLDGIDAKIDALEEEKDKILENIEIETTALKEQKEERQKYWDAQIDALKKANQERKDALELQEKLDALERARNTKVKIYKEGQGFVYDVDQTKVAEAQKALDEYLSQKAYEDELERLNNLKDAELNNYSDRIDALNKFKDETQKAYETQIKNLKKYREDTSNNYKQQIDDLKNYKDSLKKNYDEQINDLKDYKDNLKKNYDIQIDDLKEYKDSLKEYYDTQLDNLNEYKDGLEKNYEEQIDALNEYKDALEEHYDAEIEMYNEYKDQFEDMVNAYQEQQDRLLAEQLTGISFENDNWMTRLDNLANFVNEYNRLQAQLDAGTTDNTNTASMSNGGGGGNTTNSKSGTVQVSDSNFVSSTSGDVKVSSSNFSSSSTKTGYVPTTVSKSMGLSSSGKVTVKKHASGVGSIKEDEIAVVGENPNKEIVIGSKVNNGELMALNKGAGVVNADSSNTLASMLNQVGKFGSSGFGSGNGTLNNNINNDSLVVNGVTIEGSQINDPQTFVNGLLSLKSEALQRAYRHR